MQDRMTRPVEAGSSPPAPANETSPKMAQLRGMDHDAQLKALAPPAQDAPSAIAPTGARGGARPSEAMIDATFNAHWALLGKTHANIAAALEKTRAQLGGAMPASYVPPVLRPNRGSAGGSGAPYADGQGPGGGEVFVPGPVRDPKGVSRPPDQGTTEVPDDTATCDIPETEATPETPTGPGTSLSVDQQLWKKGPMGFSVKAGTDGLTGELSIQKEFKRQFPVCPGIYLQGTMGVKGFGTINVDKTGRATAQLGGEAEVRLALHGGVPGVTSVYGGGFVKVTLTGITTTWTPGSGWSFAAPLLSAKVAPVLGWELEMSGTKIDVSPGGELELARVGFDPSGRWVMERGADYDYLANLVTETQDEARARELAEKANETGGGASGASGNPR